jgi:hypothetical protein
MYLHRFDESEKTFFEVLKRLEKKQGMPLSGFDIAIPKEIILKGMNELKELRNQFKG